MPQMTPGNRLYLYQLLSRELGVGKQTALARVGEILEADGIVPEDVGCADVRALCEALPEFVKVTAFKKGYVYATVLACDEFDHALAQAGSPGEKEKGISGGKPWKRRKGGKALKPVKPRHVERPAAAPEQAAAIEERPTSAEPEGIGATEVEAAAESGAAAETTPEPVAEHEPEPAAGHAPKPTPAPASPVPHTPPISFTVTYVPDSARAAPAPTAASPEHPIASRPQADLPQDFYADVRCPDEQLSILYQLLPSDIDPVATLEEDFRVARSTGAVGGTRSEVTFPLRFLRADGTGPVTVTLRRSAKPLAGKRWSVTEVEGGEPAEVGIEGLSARPAGAWAAFLDTNRNAPAADDPERVLAQTVSLGSWDEVLERLSKLAAPEGWGQNRHVLRDYLAMTFARIQAEGLLAVADDKASAEFDTGLLTSDGRPLHALLSPLSGDIAWQLEGFSTEGSARPARYATSLAETAFDPTLPAPPFPSRDLVTRSPRTATCAYDPLSNKAVLLVPAGDGAWALRPTDQGYAHVATLSLPDAYACARVVSAEQPSWLARGLDEA